MKTYRAAAALLVLGSLAALPACSDWNGSNRYATQPSSAGTQLPQELSSDTVRQVQTSLQQEGMYKGAIDGVWGPATQSAVMSYQQAHGMTASGKLDSATMASLNLANGGAADATQTSSNAPPSSPAPAAQDTAPPAAGAPALRSDGTTTQQ